MLKMYEEDSQKRGGKKKTKECMKGTSNFRNWGLDYKDKKWKEKGEKKKERAILRVVLISQLLFQKIKVLKTTVISWILRAKVGIKNGKVSSYYYDGN